MFSKFLCKKQGHEWQGCKCSRCGKARDEHHDFQLIDDKCEQRCSICGKTEKVPHQWDGYNCSHCGTVRRFADRFLPFLHLEHKKNKMLFVTSLLLIVILAFVGIMAAREEKPVIDVVNTMGTTVVEQNIPDTFIAETNVAEASTKAIITDNLTEIPIVEEVVTVSPETDNLRTVYITKTGMKYHNSDNCNGADYSPITLNEAIRKGLEPCEKCVH